MTRLSATTIRLSAAAVTPSSTASTTPISASPAKMDSVPVTAIVPAVTGTLSILAGLALMGVVDAVLLGVTAAALSLIVVAESLVMPRIGRATRQTQQAVGVMSAALERAFGAFRTVKASGAEGREEARVRDAAVQAWRASVRADLWQGVVGNTTQLA